ncbi:MAG: dihydrolipoamide acetyltransferase family protein [Oceanospirillaceae bacterium]
MQNTTNIILEAEQLEGTQATVSNWLVSVGDKVSIDQPIVELETDKVAIEVTSTLTGVVQSIDTQVAEKVAPGDLLATISPLALIASKENSNQKTTQDIPLSKQAKALHDTQLDTLLLAHNDDTSKRHLLGPAVKKLLTEYTICADEVTGTGLNGRISKKDVQQHITSRTALSSKTPNSEVSQPLSAKSESTFIPHTPMRNSIAKHMVESLLETSPHVTSVFEMDLTTIIAHRQARKLGYQDAAVNLTFSAYFLAASALAMKEVPQINSQFHDNGLEVFKAVHIGVGTALEDSGLVVPVVRDVEQLSLFQIATSLTQQTQKARARKLTASDMQGATFTISNYGVSGSLLATPIIISQPQVAILGVGKMQKRVVVRTVDGIDTMLIKPMCYVSLSIDHRALDAYQTNKFLTKFVDIIENWGAA